MLLCCANCGDHAGALGGHGAQAVVCSSALSMQRSIETRPAHLDGVERSRHVHRPGSVYTRGDLGLMEIRREVKRVSTPCLWPWPGRAGVHGDKDGAAGRGGAGAGRGRDGDRPARRGAGPPRLGGPRAPGAVRSAPGTASSCFGSAGSGSKLAVRQLTAWGNLGADPRNLLWKRLCSFPAALQLECTDLARLLACCTPHRAKQICRVPMLTCASV